MPFAAPPGDAATPVTPADGATPGDTVTPGESSAWGDTYSGGTGGVACSGEGEGSAQRSGSGVAAGIPPHPRAPAPRAAPKGDTSRAEPGTSPPRVPVTAGPRPGDPGRAERNPPPPRDAGATTEPPRCNFVLHRSLCLPYVTQLLLARCSPPRPAQLRCNVESISAPWNGSALIIS